MLAFGRILCTSIVSSSCASLCVGDVIETSFGRVISYFAIKFFVECYELLAGSSLCASNRPDSATGTKCVAAHRNRWMQASDAISTHRTMSRATRTKTAWPSNHFRFHALNQLSHSERDDSNTVTDHKYVGYTMFT